MPDSIRTDGSNRFARESIAVRYPAIIDEAIHSDPERPAAAARELALLRDELAAGAPLRLFEPPAPDLDVWIRLFARHNGDTWLDTEWFFGEHLFYRRIIQAVRWWETGTDPFAAAKEAEYRSSRLAELLAEAGGLSRADPEERLSALLLYSLWGNRVDLSNPLTAMLGIGEHGERESNLLIDDRGAVVRRLAGTRGEVSIVTDNTGTELAMDMMLADLLIELGCRTVSLHVKIHPTFVSDATAEDVRTMIALFRSGATGRVGTALGDRLSAFLRAGRLRLAPDLYWNLPLWLSELPPRIAGLFERSSLVILKGDANYRRLVRDRMLPSGTALADAVSLWQPSGGSSLLPAILALRSLKSDPLAGITPALFDRLDRSDPEWRTNGRYGIAQLYGGGE